MFGYLTVNTQQLTPEQLKRYRAWYCGLCRTLKSEYGQLGRLTLSNDMTFLALLLSSLYEPTETGGRENCPVHPLRSRDWVRTRMSAYAADMNFLLAYWKCEDNSLDDGDMVQRKLANQMRRDAMRLEKKYPRQANALRQSLEAIHELEASRSTDTDALCRLSGSMLQEVFVPEEDAFSPMLRRLGNLLGQLIYLMDAWEDYDEDQRKKRFNPLSELHTQADFERLMHESMMMLAGEAAEACSLLPLEKDADLISHVLYHGIWIRYAERIRQRGIVLEDTSEVSSS